MDTYGLPEEKKVLEKDMLFATLETAVRKIDDGSRKPFYLADTVGFINNLPHGLVKAFRSTLEEIKEADLILQVIDFSDVNYKKHMEVTEETLKELDAGHIPVIYVYNKADLCMPEIPRCTDNRIYMSAQDEACIRTLLTLVTDTLYAHRIETEFLIPYDKGGIVSELRENAEVLSQDYIENGVRLVVKCSEKEQSKFRMYISE